MRGGGQFCAYCINSSFLFVRYVKTRVFRLSLTGWAQAVEKPVIASQSADWRGNPFLKCTTYAFSCKLRLKDCGFPRLPGGHLPQRRGHRPRYRPVSGPEHRRGTPGVDQGRSGGRAGGVHRVSAVRLTAAKNVGIIPLEIEQARPCGRACFRKEDTL